MRMKALSTSVSAFSWRLRSVCLRYGVAKPSVWPCRRVWKRPQFNHFRSDSPLTFTWLWFRFSDVGVACACAGLLWCIRLSGKCWRVRCRLSRLFLLAFRLGWSCLDGLLSITPPFAGRPSLTSSYSGMTVCAVVRISVEIDNGRQSTNQMDRTGPDADGWCRTTSVQKG
jgi:hypothetical protein